MAQRQSAARLAGVCSLFVALYNECSRILRRGKDLTDVAPTLGYAGARTAGQAIILAGRAEAPSDRQLGASVNLYRYLCTFPFTDEVFRRRSPRMLVVPRRRFRRSSRKPRSPCSTTTPRSRPDGRPARRVDDAARGICRPLDPQGRAEVVVYFFGKGQGGNVDANLARWKGQFSTSDGSPFPRPSCVIRPGHFRSPSPNTGAIIGAESARGQRIPCGADRHSSLASPKLLAARSLSNSSGIRPGSPTRNRCFSSSCVACARRRIDCLGAEDPARDFSLRVRTGAAHCVHSRVRLCATIPRRNT